MLMCHVVWYEEDDDDDIDNGDGDADGLDKYGDDDDDGISDIEKKRRMSMTMIWLCFKRISKLQVFVRNWRRGCLSCRSEVPVFLHVFHTIRRMKVS
ncbi:hypothetical protein ElyMa_002104200 [Elysia marginata]|uniref:Uncharacterized protein n=1 Tax=Elysia marginata TaxID=1093978 RepID=A0AAV4FG41_9GAST|nr:hypothetical protein ElyMa_002104200 [Elysia marginata]